MAQTLPYTGSSVTIGSTEYSLVNSSTTVATLTTVGAAAARIRVAAMAAGDEYEIAIWEKVISGGTQERLVLANLVGAQTDPFFTPFVPVAYGWDFTIKKIAGTDRAFSWTIFLIS